MKKIARISFLLLLAFVIGISTADAQNYGRKKKKKKKKPKTEKTDDYFDESGGFAHKLWYGGMVNFQISGGNGGNTLLLGLSPMVGYKVNDMISFGPRITFNYIEGYVPGPNLKIRELGVGAFGRAKFSQALFAHIEYEVINVKELSDFGYQFGGRDENFYAGVGYNSALGGAFGYEIMGLYNFMEEDESRVPIELRIGFTYNF